MLREDVESYESVYIQVTWGELRYEFPELPGLQQINI